MSAPIEPRHREAAAKAFKVTDDDLAHRASAEEATATEATIVILEVASQALADQEAEIAERIANLETPATVVEQGYGDGFQLGVLAALTVVKRKGHHD